MEPLINEANEAAVAFKERLRSNDEQDSQEEAKQGETDSKEAGDINALIKTAVWHQPKGSTHPIEIGKAKDLGLNSSFTALCWVKNEKKVVSEW